MMFDGQGAMLADLDETIRNLLKRELPINNGEIDIKFDQPKREWSGRLTKPTINFYLYDMRENVQLRQQTWEKVNGGGPLIGRKKRTPFRFDCYYMLTIWANDPEDEHNLLAATVLTLLRFPILHEGFLHGQMVNQPFEVPARVGAHDKLTNPAEVWGAMDNEIRPTVPYIVTVSLDPWTVVEGPSVRTFVLRAGQAEGLPYTPTLPAEKIAFEKVIIGGIVTNKEGAPQAGLTVALRGTGYLTTTAVDGTYHLGGVPAGDYTLVVWPAKGRPKQKSINIPAADGDYNLEI
jgi:hypothetical protein